MKKFDPKFEKNWVGEFQYERGKCTKSTCEYHDKLMEGNCAGAYQNGPMLPHCTFWTGRKSRS